MTAPTDRDRLDMESIGWQGCSRLFGTLGHGDPEPLLLRPKAQPAEESQPAQGVFPLADEAFGPDSADGWTWL